ncbi:MAG: bifunctional UDP-N-acetylglucosamine diphosphorylase/glucosamine-1-phosphate N-acetyltransferase GlmU [Endozoicomonadaceae bacterium]|nr:bifunctional UDP-N-acetylglucosamine diphosphorylase/glucosamine-1-phosphate N-acetyltransferase GlmU [Endozoicomonadaceae bacterium]
MKIETIILAAGQGSRMKSSLPKVLHPIAGSPMLEHVILSAQTLHARQTNAEGGLHVVIGYGADQVRDRLGNYAANWVEQKEQLGTGHAVKQAAPNCSQADIVLVLYGDVPLIQSTTLASLAAACNGERLALLTINLPNPSGYGRIVRDETGAIQAIVEDKDASSEQHAITEVNTGIMAIPGKRLTAWLENISCKNAQNEYYLTDIVAMAVAEGTAVVHAQPQTATEVQGVNNRAQQAKLERQLQRHIAEKLMASGVTLLDPNRLDVRGSLQAGNDVVIDINCVFEGDVVLEDGVQIGPNCILSNTRIGVGTRIKANSIIDASVIEADCDIGPFSRLRLGTHLADRAKIGNFVETKKAVIGVGSKINHLSYVGDAEIGVDVNVGAGTITCNYDRVNKLRTEIGDGAFIGSNTSLVAPLIVGAGATVGAGSTITHDIPEESLSVARGRQKNIEGWKRPEKKS